MKSGNESHPVPTLLFIPDISGFTKFIHETEAAHSQHIIEELLEVLIDANEMSLEISEIEGDAILFYRTGPTPTAVEILAQVQKMYEKFHFHLKKYETQRICQCGACVSAHDLELKFIIHFGDISKKHVKSYTKLFGRDVIVAHRLMKNDIDIDEYAMITHQLLNSCKTWVDIEQMAWDKPVQSEESFDFGSVKFCYLNLEPLQSHVPTPTAKDLALPYRMMKVTEVEAVVPGSLEEVFNLMSDVHSKHIWVMGVQESDQVSTKILQDGTSHRCIMPEDMGNITLVSHDFDFDNDVITWKDTNFDAKSDIIVRLRRIGNEMTRVNMTVTTKYHPWKRLMLWLFKEKQMTGFFGASLNKLAEYFKTLKQEGKKQPVNVLIAPAETKKQESVPQS